MKQKQDALFSKYVIDGVRYDVTPAQMLDECMLPSAAPEDGTSDEFEDIWDETADFPPENMEYSRDRFPEYVRKVTDAASAAQDREFNLLYPESFARQRVAAALIDTLWLEGEFRLEDLRLWADWKWNSSAVGNMAAFYNCVQSVNEYVYELGVEIQGYLYEDGAQQCTNSYFATLASYGNENCDDEDEAELEDVTDKDWEEGDAPAEDSLWTVGGSADVNFDRNRDVWMGDERNCYPHLVDSAGSFLIYVPFDTCSPKLGGSLFSRALGCGGGAAPAISDSDYFIDCYEVVHDLVSDGAVLASRTVCDGGLAVAAMKLAEGSGMGVRLNAGGVCDACGESDILKVLFAEIPGVLLQIADADGDYVDSQFLLQDVAYYRVGRPDRSVAGVEAAPVNNGIDRVLSALLDGASEGED